MAGETPRWLLAASSDRIPSMLGLSPRQCRAPPSQSYSKRGWTPQGLRDPPRESAGVRTRACSCLGVGGIS